jgi:pimeloyl-ACP methyl ester carboxylesterase
MSHSMHFVSDDGLELHYEEYGRGEPLLLLHGMTGCADDWRYAGRERLAEAHRVIAVDARGHGRSNNPSKELTHKQCALDTLRLLDHLGLPVCKAIGASMGGNTLLHMATMAPERVEAMVVVSATLYFPEQARAVMRQVDPDDQPAEEWRVMRERHKRGDEAIIALWRHQRDLKDSYDDMNFTPPRLSLIEARTLIVYGDRDFLYPIEMAVEMRRAIPKSALMVVPNAGHCPIYLDAADAFVRASLAFLRG